MYAGDSHGGLAGPCGADSWHATVNSTGHWLGSDTEAHDSGGDSAMIPLGRMRKAKISHLLPTAASSVFVCAHGVSTEGTTLVGR